MAREIRLIETFCCGQLKPPNQPPPAGMLERYRLQEWLNFVSSEIHKGYSPLFNPTSPSPLP